MSILIQGKQYELLQYVKQAHGDQVRKYTNEPYWNHLLNVADIVHNYDNQAGMIEIALCHDLFEDTSETYETLQAKLTELQYNTQDRIFILRGVEALTDKYTKDQFPYFNRKDRKEMEAHRLGKIGSEYQTVKYADMIDNTKSIIEHDISFAKKYVSEKRYMLNLMRNGNIDLFITCYQSLLEAESLIAGNVKPTP